MFNGGFKGVRAADGAGFVSARDVAVQQSSPQPKITSWAYTNGAYVPYPDTAIAGGETIVIYGSGFQSNANVVIGGTTITSTRLDPNRITFTAPSLSAGSYPLYVANPGGGTAVYLPGVVYNSYPVFNSTSYANTFVSATTSVGFSLNVTGSPSLTFSLQSGSSLPTGLTLAANGYISGSTTVSNTTVYNFTVIATDSYAQATQASITYTITYVISDTYFNSTTLLLNGETNTNTYIQDISTNNFALTPIGAATPNRFSPLWGNGYYGVDFFYGGFQTPASSLTNITGSFTSTSTFTIETFVKMNALPASTGVNLVGDMQVTSTLNYWSFQINTSGQLQLYWYNGSVQTAVGNTVMVPGSWYHVAVSISSGAIKLFVNGVLQTITGTTTTSTPTGSTSYISVGEYNSYGFNGTLSNLRISSTALYSTTFTAPTSPLTSQANTTFLSCLSNQFSDIGPNSYALTLSSTPKVVASQPFATLPTTSTANTNGQGYYSGAILGGSNLLTYPTSLNLGTAPFTIEFWFYISNLGNSGIYFLYDYINNSSRWTVQWNGPGWAIGHYDGGSWIYTATSTSSVTLGQWTHLAITRDSSSTMRVYVNGVLGATTANFTRNFTNSGSSKTILNDPTGDGTATGFMSNLRIVNGTALYTGSSFTPSTTPLTAVAGTTMLTLQNSTFIDNSANNNVFTPTGLPYVSQNQPFASPTVTSNTITPNIYGSGYLDGSTGYLTTPAGSYADFGSNAFTVECWIYTTVTSTQQVIAFHGWSGSGGYNNGWNLQINTSNQIAFYANGTLVAFTDLVISPNNWTHIAVVGSGGVLSAYKNGIKSTVTNTYTSIVARATATTVLGGWNNTNENIAERYWYAGYISNFRIVNGTALYTNTFLPPNQPVTPISNTQLLSFQYKNSANNNVFYDDSVNNWPLTRTGAATQGTFTPFTQTGWSNYFDQGIGGFISTPGNPTQLQLGSNNFTVECWFFMTAAPTWSVATIFSVEANGLDGVFIGINGTNTPTMQPVMYLSTTGGSYTGNANPGLFSTTLSLNKWTHIAYVRNGNVFSCYINGVQDPTTFILPGALSYNSSCNATVGARAANAGNYFPGILSNVRVINGTALYTSNFTPSTTPLTAVANTALLTCQSNRFIDNSNNTFTLTQPNGGVQVEPFSPFPPGVTYSTANNGASLYFSSSSDSVVQGSTTAWVFAGDFTIEGWFFFMPSGAGTSRAFVNTSGGNMYLNTDNTLHYVFQGVTDFGSSQTVNAGQWVHLVVCRNGGTYRFFVNGNMTTGTGSTASIGATGGINVGTASAFYAYGVKISNGVSLYNSSFTIPNSLTTVASNNSLALLGTNSGIQDVTGKNDIITYGSLKTQANTVKFGNNSMYFDGSTGYALIPNSAFMLVGSSNFTIEYWLYPTTSTTQSPFMLNGNGSGYGIRADIVGTSNYVQLLVSTSGSSWAINSTSSTAVSLNSWSHIAIVRNGTAMTVYLNGNSIISTTISGSIVLGTINYVGASYYSSAPVYFFNGYMDDFRITNGIARYTGNFTPPAFQFLGQ